MNTQLTIQYIQTLTDAIAEYLRINTQYRRTHHNNPDRKQQLKQTRANLYRLAQEANQQLHTHLLQYNSPASPAVASAEEGIRLHARELIQRWDTRNTAYENLATAQHTGTWHERPADKITRLDKAETRLRDQLRTITAHLLKIATES